MIRRCKPLFPFFMLAGFVVLALGPTSEAGKAKKVRAVPTAPVPLQNVEPAPVQPLPDPPAPALPSENPPTVVTPVFSVPIDVTGPEKVKRFHFKIKPDAPLESLLPVPPNTPAPTAAPWNEDLAKVPEVNIGEPMAKNLGKNQTLRNVAHGIAKINHLNRQQTDGFLKELTAQRSELRGMPFRMGTDCRTGEEQAAMFRVAAEMVHEVLQSNKGGDTEQWAKTWSEALQVNNFLAVMPDSQLAQELKDARIKQLTPDVRNNLYRAIIAALMQIMGPESAQNRAALARVLATMPHVDATKALAKLVLFSPEPEVRAAAIEGLKLRREKDYTEELLQGFQYPLPAVSRRAAEAFVQLDRQDMLARLVDVLEQPDPRAPTEQTRDGQSVPVVRELIRVNHHRNCLLCHAPGNSENVPESVLTVPVPLPNEPLPEPATGYQHPPETTPDIFVRIDVTYLRQDFSQRMPVADAQPWPLMQRFDFFVRTRVLEEEEVRAYQEPTREAGWVSPYHRAALYALRELTGRDTEPTPQAWRRLLNLPRQGG